MSMAGCQCLAGVAPVFNNNEGASGPSSAAAEGPGIAAATACSGAAGRTHSRAQLHSKQNQNKAHSINGLQQYPLQNQRVSGKSG
jgi:hypothetical protein